MIMNIKLVIFDFDGVFTDGKCYFDENHNIKKYYDIKDGMGIKLLKDNKIKTGLISSFSTDKNVLLNEQNINLSIITHLKFDYVYIGDEKKINILNKWIKELDLNYNNVSYIGDDINDIELLKLVKYSACPNNAVNECKEIVNYICKNKGGEGCVREFVEKIIHNEFSMTIIDEIKKEFQFQIENFNVEKIKKLCDILKNIERNIYFCGVGKSGNIAKHCCDLLKSISFTTFYIDILNLTHGDIGTFSNKDIILMFSNSGNTIELLNIIQLFKNIGIKTVGICCKEESRFKELCDTTIVIPFKNEISGTIDKIPTNSCMSQLIFTNILVSILKNDISLDKYKENHLSGNIGKNLLKIKDVLIKEFPKIIFKEKILLHEVLLKMTDYKIGCCFFVEKNDYLIGLLTDGDIRRMLIEDENKKCINLENINQNFYYETNLNKFLFNIDLKYNYIPILENKIIKSIIRV